MNTFSDWRTEPPRSWALHVAVLGVFLAVPSTAGAAPSAPSAAPLQPPSEATLASTPEDEPTPPDPPLPEGLTMPVLKRDVSFAYPDALAQEAVPPSGTVRIRFVVDVDGSTREHAITQSVHPQIDAQALEAVAALEYDPALYEGEPVEVVWTIDIPVSPPPPLAADPEPEVRAAEAEPDMAPDPVPAGPVRIQGVILEAGDRQPIQGAEVTVYPTSDTKLGRVPYRKRKAPTTEPTWTAGTQTDENGAFELRDVHNGRVRVVIMTQGFERLEYVVDLGDNERLDLKYYQVRMSTNPYRTEVETEADDFAEVRRHKLKPEELAKLPGTNGDALKAVQNFPGVARSPFGIGQLVVRGAAPGDSRVYLAGHEIPSLFHFGGVTSVFNSSLIESMSLVPGNFDSRYGNAVGGVVNIETRKGRRDGYHGYVKADVFDAAGVAEGPIGKGSFSLSARRSYIDAILPAVLPKDGNLAFSVAPRYYDYSGSFDYPIAGGEFTARVLGSDDRLSLILGNDNDDQPDNRASVDTVIWFHRADLAYKKTWNDWTFFVSPSYRRDFFSLGVGNDLRLHFTNDRFSGRAEVSRKVGERSSWRMGAEVVTDWTLVDVKGSPVDGGALGGRGGSGPAGGEQVDQLVSSYRTFAARPALYSTFRWGITDRFALSPGFRLTYIAGPRNTATIDPRLSAEVRATDTTTVTGAVGIYSQTRNDATNDRSFGNPRLKPEQSLHVSLGVAQEFGDGWTASGTGFYKRLWSLASASPDIIEDSDGQQRPELFDNEGTGRIYGGEFMLRKDMTDKLYGWAAYTVSRSEVRQRAGTSFELFDFDQTHVLTVLAAYRLPRNWQIGARFRLASGNPYTPTNDAVAQLREGFQIPVPADYNSARLRMFHQLDLRIDKTWSFQRVALAAYLDIQNLYNAKNPEFVNPSWNFQQQTTVNSLPIIPSVGLKLAW